MNLNAGGIKVLQQTYQRNAVKYRRYNITVENVQGNMWHNAEGMFLL